MEITPGACIIELFTAVIHYAECRYAECRGASTNKAGAPGQLMFNCQIFALATN